MHTAEFCLSSEREKGQGNAGDTGGRTQLEKMGVPDGPRPTAAAAGQWLTSGLPDKGQNSQIKAEAFYFRKEHADDTAVNKRFATKVC